MKRTASYPVIVLLQLILWSVPFLVNAQIIANTQKNNEAVRVENGMMIIRFDKRDGTNFNQLLQYFGLKEDSVWKYHDLGQLTKDGWKLLHIDNNVAEIEKPVSNSVTINGGLPIYLSPDAHISGALGYPAQVVYGINNFKANATIFENKKDETVFLLRGFSNAKKVFLSGNFNNWSTGAAPMQHTDSGWVSILKLKPGKYYYKYIVDGQWILDPANSKRENDGQGNFNSVYFHYNYVFKLRGNTSSKKVILAGSFNNWNEKELSMQRTGDGWQLPLFLNEGTHAYKFIVDGQWMLDPSNKVTRPDGKGNFNSFMSLGDTIYFKLDGYTNANLVILTGSFNGWNSAELSMTRTKTGWQIPYVLAPGNYEYKFIVDGKWITDPANPFSSGDAEHLNSIRVIKPNYVFVLKKFPNAKNVLLSGNFNGWADPGYSMNKVEGEWKFPIYLTAGKYTYKFKVDGTWITDPDNKLYEENQYGTGNSVLWMEPAITDFEK